MSDKDKLLNSMKDIAIATIDNKRIGIVKNIGDVDEFITPFKLTSDEHELKRIYDTFTNKEEFRLEIQINIKEGFTVSYKAVIESYKFKTQSKHSKEFTVDVNIMLKKN